MYKLSIIVPNYNYGHFLNRFFDSLKEQSLNLKECELLFIDDGSDDNSLDLAKKLIGLLDLGGYQIIESNRNKRPGIVRNIGLEIASAEYIVSIDPDDTFYPDFLASSVRYLDNNPKVDVSYTSYFNVFDDHSELVNLPKFSPLLLRIQNIVLPASTYRSSFIKDKIRYRSNTDYEDWDFWLQFLCHGAKFSCIDEPLYNQHFHSQNFSYQARDNDGISKGHIVLNNPNLFSEKVISWAKDMVRNRPHTPSFQRGIIPRPQDLEKVHDLLVQKL